LKANGKRAEQRAISEKLVASIEETAEMTEKKAKRVKKD